MAVLLMVTTSCLSFASRGGVESLGHSTLRALMVLPTWSLTRWTNGPPGVVAVGAGLCVALASVVGWRSLRARRARSQ
jgi:hypothetical protein